jgi:hypothetical protein
MRSIQEAVALVETSFPSIFSKEDVLKLLSSIQAQPTLPEDFAEGLVDKIATKINNGFDRYNSTDKFVDYDSAEFEIDYNNKLTLNFVEIDTDAICDKVNDAVQGAVDEMMEELFPQPSVEPVTETESEETSLN